MQSCDGVDFVSFVFLDNQIEISVLVSSLKMIMSRVGEYKIETIK